MTGKELKLVLKSKGFKIGDIALLYGTSASNMSMKLKDRAVLKDEVVRKIMDVANLTDDDFCILGRSCGDNAVVDDDIAALKEQNMRLKKMCEHFKQKYKDVNYLMLNMARIFRDNDTLSDDGNGEEFDDYIEYSDFEQL